MHEAHMVKTSDTIRHRTRGVETPQSRPEYTITQKYNFMANWQICGPHAEVIWPKTVELREPEIRLWPKAF